MENYHKLLIFLAVSVLLFVGLMTGDAVSKNQSTVEKATSNAQSAQLENSPYSLLKYYTQGFFVDGTTATSKPGSGTQDGLRCPLYSTVNYHVDVSFKTTATKAPTSLKDFAVLERGKTGLCSGKKVSSSAPKYIGKAGSNYRYAGTFVISNDKDKVDYDPCVMSGAGKYTHPGNSNGDQIYTCVYPDAPQIRSCWKDSSDPDYC